jgi:hypothetical protein
MSNEMSLLSIVAEAEEQLYKNMGSQPSIDDLARYIWTSKRELQIFLMRYKDEAPLKDIGLAFDIGPDRVTQLLHKFSHNLLQFCCRIKNDVVEKKYIPLGGIDGPLDTKEHLLERKIKSFTERVSKLRALLVKMEEKNYKLHVELSDSTEEFNELSSELITIKNCFSRLFEKKEDANVSIFDKEIDECEFTTRVKNGLRGEQVGTVGQLVKVKEKDLFKIPGIGKKYVRQIKAFLNKNDLKLGMDMEDGRADEE